MLQKNSLRINFFIAIRLMKNLVLVLFIITLSTCQQKNEKKMRQIAQPLDSPAGSMESLRGHLSDILLELSFVGEWKDEDNQFALLVEANNTCTLKMTSYGSSVQVKGKWQSYRNKLNVLWEKPSDFSKSQKTFFGLKKAKNKEILYCIPSKRNHWKGEIQIAFVRN